MTKRPAIDLKLVKSRVSAFDPESPPSQDDLRHAAVALCCRPKNDLEVLFIRRAEHPRDPWSGHMAFPGGRVEPWDSDPLQAAVRETDEEVSVQLSTPDLIGPLSPIQAPHRGRRSPLLVHPFVFEVPRHTQTRPDTREVQETVWIPLSFFRDGAERQTMTWQYGGQTYHLPCFDYEGRRIWGMTLRMLDQLLDLIR
ncbi:MAG: NUDIX hydrolase [Myxococcota bacterium]